MNPPNYYHHHIILQQPFYYYYACVVPAPQVAHNQVISPAYYIAGVFYPQTVEYVDDVAIHNTPNTIQQPMHSSYVQNQYVPYRRAEDDAFFDPSFIHPLEAFLDESMIMHELEANPALQRVTAHTSGSGLSEEKISEHLHVYTTQGKVTEVGACSICLDEYGKNEKMGILECGHRYHAECIKRWLLSKNVCPMCRSTALTV